jgi:hypothetical protein
MPMNRSELSAVLRRWSVFSDRLIQPRAVELESWRRLVAALDRDSVQAASRLKELLAASDTLFPGLGDPLGKSNLNPTDHRWLRRDREESYSDWLAWILQRQTDFRKILSLFNLRAVEGSDRWTIDRESPITRGRPDILIRHQTLGTLLVEVKTGSAPSDEQLNRYREFLNERRAIGLVLLAPAGFDTLVPDAFTFCSWSHVCFALREWAHDWLRDRLVYQAAMALTFCGAVERNLLHLGYSGPGAVLMANHIAQWLESTERNHSDA